MSEATLLNVPGVVDTKLEEAGDWFDHERVPGSEHLLLDDNGNGLKAVKVCSRFTSSYREAERKAEEKILRRPRSKRSLYRTESIMELTGRHCVLDWDFTDRDGNAIPFSTETAVNLMTDSSYRHYKDFILMAVATLQGEVEEIKEEDEGN